MNILKVGGSLSDDASIKTWGVALRVRNLVRNLFFRVRGWVILILLVLGPFRRQWCFLFGGRVEYKGGVETESPSPEGRSWEGRRLEGRMAEVVTFGGGGMRLWSCFVSI